MSELDQTLDEEAPEAPETIKKGVPAPAANGLEQEQPSSSVKSGIEKVPEPEPVCTSTKRDKTNALLDSCEPTASTAAAVPGTEVTQMIVNTMAKTFQKSLQAIVKPEESRSKPSSYKNPIKDGSIDNWVVLMKRYLDSRKTPMSPKDKAWMILENLEGEARNYIMNKAASELDDPERVFNCLTRRFGSGAGKPQIRMTFANRTQGEDEDMMTFLDALESLRTKGFPDEDLVTRRYEIMQKFIAGVRSVEVHGALAAKYAEEKYVTEPPSEEDLRYVAMEFVRLRKPRWERRTFKPLQSSQPMTESQPHRQPLLRTPSQRSRSL